MLPWRAKIPVNFSLHRVSEIQSSRGESTLQMSRPATAKRTKDQFSVLSSQFSVLSSQYRSVESRASPPGWTGETPVTTLTFAAAGQSGRFDKAEKALLAIGRPPSLPRPASRLIARGIATGRRAAHAASGSAGSIPWIRNYRWHRERDARRIRSRARAPEDRPQSSPLRAQEFLPEASSSPTRTLRRGCERFPKREPEKAPASSRWSGFAKSPQCPIARSAASKDACQ